MVQIKYEGKYKLLKREGTGVKRRIKRRVYGGQTVKHQSVRFLYVY